MNYVVAKIDTETKHGFPYAHLKTDVDGKSVLWQLYTPEEKQYQDP